jgi:hypothetical protein
MHKEPDRSWHEQRKAIGGTILRCELKHTSRYGVLKTRCGRRYTGRVGKDCWVWNVVVMTDEGWKLAGYIGEAASPDWLPDLRVGDRVECDPLTVWWKNGPAFEKAAAVGIYWTRRNDRRLTGRIVRSAK